MLLFVWVNAVCVQVPTAATRGLESLEAGVTGRCKLLCVGGWGGQYELDLWTEELSL